MKHPTPLPALTPHARGIRATTVPVVVTYLAIILLLSAPPAMAGPSRGDYQTHNPQIQTAAPRASIGILPGGNFVSDAKDGPYIWMRIHDVRAGHSTAATTQRFELVVNAADPQTRQRWVFDRTRPEILDLESGLVCTDAYAVYNDVKNKVGLYIPCAAGDTLQLTSRLVSTQTRVWLSSDTGTSYSLSPSEQ